MANNKMLIDAAHPEETRVAMVRGNSVDEFDFESEHKTQLRGNIYLAKVTRVEPSLQAAFVDYGGNRHGFLAFSEIHPDYYQIPVADRQALLDAEAEDARIAAAEEAEADEDVDADTEVEAKPARKRRSRRRGGKKTAEASDEAGEDATDSTPESEASDDNGEAGAAAEDIREEKAEVADETSGDNDVAEESDSDDETMAADNDGDDVVSEPAGDEPAKKPRRRTSRTKKVAAEAVTEEAAPESNEKDEKKPARRRTSRKKAEPEAQEEAVEAIAADSEEETPNKPRRRTSRKKVVPEAEEGTVEAKSTDEEEAPKKTRRRSIRAKKTAENVSDTTDNEIDAKSEDAPENAPTEAKEESGRKSRSRSRSRSRRGKRDESTENGSGDEESDNGAVEDLGSQDAMEEVPTRRTPRKHYKIQEVIKRRQILLVQVVKEERGNKGAALTTYLSLAGRYSVLMPNTARGGGISRKITNAADRKRLKSIASGFEVPQGMGVILRTAGASQSPEEIQRDFEYLMRLWENVRTLTLESTAPCLVYEEGSLIKRSIRDLYDKDTGEILVAGEAGHREAKDFMTMLMPEHAKNVKLYKDRVPMFARMGVEAQLDAMLQPQVTLKSGGYLIIDQTEALVAIDVNSGRSTRQHSIEETATQTNLEAADEVARQLRLRDLAGLIVIDFIDMEDRRNIRNVEKRLKDALKNDRARIQVGRISHFGLMEMSRQRIRASVLESTTQTCPTCDGLGHVRSSSSVVLGVLRAIEEHLNRNSRNDLIVKVSTQTALYLLNSKRETLSDLESRFGISLDIQTDNNLGTTPCTIERGELSSKAPPAQESAVQPDTIDPDNESTTAKDDSQTTADASAQEEVASEEKSGDGRKRRRRRRRKGSNNEEASGEAAEVGSTEIEAKAESPDDGDGAVENEAAKEEKAAKPKPRRRTRSKKSDDYSPVTTSDNSPSETDQPSAVDTAPPTEEVTDTQEEQPKRRTTRRKVASVAEEVPSETTSEAIAADEPGSAEPETEGKKPRKSGWWQRKFF